MLDIRKDSTLMLKKLTQSYMTEFFKTFNDEEICQYLNCPYPLTRDWVKSYINDALRKSEAGEKYSWAVINRRTNLFIGVGVIKNIDTKNKVGELGYCLEKASWFKGFTELTVWLMLEYAFTKINLNRIEIRVDIENKKTINFLNKIGAEQEGRMRQAVFSKGNYYDIYLYSILYDDYLRWKINKKE